MDELCLYGSKKRAGTLYNICLSIKNRKVPVHNPLEEEGRAMINGETATPVAMDE